MIHSILKYISSKISYFYTYIYANYLLRKKLTKKVCEIEECEILISLTSYWKRFDTLSYTLESLFSQDCDIKYGLILILSTEDIEKFGGYPINIDKYIKMGLIVKVQNENLKSYKKAFYSYELGKPIITVDDDIFYPKNWLNNFYKCIVKHPNIVLAYRGHYITTNSGNFTNYNSWLNWSKNHYIGKSLFSFLPTGTSGIYYPLDSLRGLKESKEIFQRICPNADDLWFKYITVKNGYKSMRLSSKNQHFVALSKSESLYDLNVLKGENDKQFKNIIEYDNNFKETIKLDSFDI